ncbi:unnamed protein product [Calicophoron daubneyi]|uniref:Uncharacterized protein n=1 Tax=Calicophoron daubneyi TaxID=300641 RepID=A0AAV2TPM5_CALDB
MSKDCCISELPQNYEKHRAGQKTTILKHLRGTNSKNYQRMDEAIEDLKGLLQRIHTRLTTDVVVGEEEDVAVRRRALMLHYKTTQAWLNTQISNSHEDAQTIIEEINSVKEVDEYTSYKIPEKYILPCGQYFLADKQILENIGLRLTFTKVRGIDTLKGFFRPHSDLAVQCSGTETQIGTPLIWLIHAFLCHVIRELNSVRKLHSVFCGPSETLPIQACDEEFGEVITEAVCTSATLHDLASGVGALGKRYFCSACNYIIGNLADSLKVEEELFSDLMKSPVTLRESVFQKPPPDFIAHKDEFRVEVFNKNFIILLDVYTAAIAMHTLNMRLRTMSFGETMERGMCFGLDGWNLEFRDREYRIFKQYVSIFEDEDMKQQFRCAWETYRYGSQYRISELFRIYESEDDNNIPSVVPVAPERHATDAPLRILEDFYDDGLLRQLGSVLCQLIDRIFVCTEKFRACYDERKVVNEESWEEIMSNNLLHFIDNVHNLQNSTQQLTAGVPSEYLKEYKKNFECLARAGMVGSQGIINRKQEMMKLHEESHKISRQQLQKRERRIYDYANYRTGELQMEEYLASVFEEAKNRVKYSLDEIMESVYLQCEQDYMDRKRKYESVIQPTVVELKEFLESVPEEFVKQLNAIRASTSERNRQVLRDLRTTMGFQKYDSEFPPQEEDERIFRSSPERLLHKLLDRYNTLVWKACIHVRIALELGMSTFDSLKKELDYLTPDQVLERMRKIYKMITIGISRATGMILIDLDDLEPEPASLLFQVISDRIHDKLLPSISDAPPNVEFTGHRTLRTC